MKKTPKKTITLVKFTLLVAFDGTQSETHLEALGDRLAEDLRDDDRALTAAAEYDHVETTAPMDDDIDAVIDALRQQFPPDALAVGPCPGVKVLGRNGTFKDARLTHREDRFELWLGTPKERYPLVTFPAPRQDAGRKCPACGAFLGNTPSCQTCKDHRLRELLR